jgi:uncharacterized membrane protein YfcA
MAYLLVLVVGLVAGTISGIIGTGASIMLVPVLVLAFGPQEAIPIMAIAAVMGNVAKMSVWWREIDWRACLAYSVTGIPAAAMGARTLLALPPRAVDLALGVFFILMIPLGHWLHGRRLRLRLPHLALAGAVIGFLTGVVASTGPLSVPAFVAYGLVKGGFIATEAASALAVYVSKVVTFRGLGALPFDAVMRGLITGSSLMVGAVVAKRIVLRLSPEIYRALLDVLLLCSGVTLLWAGTR